nr:hypothetical protein [Tanacetum cinerariifolium]
MIQPELKGSTRGYPLVSVEVLMDDKRSKSENMGIVPTKMELILEHTQQGQSLRICRKLKDRGEDFRYSDAVRPSSSDEVLKLKNFKKDESKSYQDIQSRKVEHMIEYVTKFQRVATAHPERVSRKQCLDTTLNRRSEITEPSSP